MDARRLCDGTGSVRSHDIARRASAGPGTEHDEGIGDGEALRLRVSGENLRSLDADPWRLWLQPRSADRTLSARREALHDRRRNIRGAAPGDCATRPERSEAAQ